jgi:serine/threonine-protein kinase HipA
MQLLNVWLEASPQPIGQLAAADDTSMAFVYAPEWLDAAENHPLSLSLPLREEPFGDALTRAFFDNLLQENDQLERVMLREGIERGDIAGLLAHVGADCAGAVSVLPLDHPPIKRPGSLADDYDVLSDQDFRDLVHRLATGRPLPVGMRDPSPVAGFRRKISLAELPGRGFGLPRARTGAPTTHILKIPDPDHRHEARDEAFVTLLAHQCGLDVGTCVASEVDGHEILLIRRFDRVVHGDAIFRIHQEDFAQAAGLPAALKYERNGTEGRRFDAATIGRILAATDRPALARATFLRLTLFNLLIGNNDNHAKNHALLHRPGQAPMLAKFYDLVPVQTVAGFTDLLAFRIGEAETADALARDNLLQLCADIGLPIAGAGRLLAEATREMITSLEQLSPDFPSEMSALDSLTGEVAGQLDAMLELGLKIRARDAHVTRGGGWLAS